MGILGQLNYLRKLMKHLEVKKEKKNKNKIKEMVKKEKRKNKRKSKRKNKKKVIAKSIVSFDVKVYEQEEDLEKLFTKIKNIEIDGLVWNQDIQILPVAFGMNKLRVGCVVED